MLQDESFYNSDGDLLIVPEQGVLRVRTECGLLEVAPGECMVLPQGMKMTVELKDGHATARGWVAEIFEGHFSLPNRGPFGSNGMYVCFCVLLLVTFQNCLFSFFLSFFFFFLFFFFLGVVRLL